MFLCVTSFILVELVQERISVEMKIADEGFILHDGWSKFGIHYVGLFASYCRKMSIIENGVQSTKYFPETVLLSVAPLVNVPAEDDEEGTKDDDHTDEDNDLSEEINLDPQETIRFTAEAHVSHFREIFLIFGIDLEAWVVCQVADSAPVNTKVADLLKIPQINCCNHLLNL